MITLPIDAALPDIKAALRLSGQLLLEAEPGAGKSTRVAPALAAAGRTWLLQPRRVAALAIAQRIASEQPGWQLGREVGYAVRHDRRGGEQTQCWVATDGVVLRQLLHDPLLEHIDCLLFDEFQQTLSSKRIVTVMGLILYRVNCGRISALAFYQPPCRQHYYRIYCLRRTTYRYLVDAFL